jgi:hypothetical protein
VVVRINPIKNSSNPINFRVAKATQTNLDVNRNRDLDEASPVATADVEPMPKVEEKE